MAQPPPIITLTTDFGTASHYVAQMKGVIYGIAGAVTIVDITHEIPPQDVFAGALALGDATHTFPESAVHVAVVDPGVGTDREVLAVKTSGGVFVAPDNGLISHVASKSTVETIVAVRNQRWWRTPVSPTFHGRDIMAPVAAHLAIGVPLDEFGDRISEFCLLDTIQAAVEENRIRGQIISIDSFGNAQSSITTDDLPAGVSPESFWVTCGEHRLLGLQRTYGDAETGRLVALVGSSGRIELAIVNGDAAGNAGLARGQTIMLEWSP